MIFSDILETLQIFENLKTYDTLETRKFIQARLRSKSVELLESFTPLKY